MELSPKQQAVNEIKNAKQILILGHKTPDGDQLGSLLALKYALGTLDKAVDLVVSNEIKQIFNFLPGISEVKKNYKHTDGKILKIDMKRIPVKGMKWQREDDYLNIYLDTEKNLKFEFIEILNGMPKPDLIITVDTPDVKSIDDVYDQNTNLFFEAPVLNIDHHPGNEYYGTINLIDLTATSTAEILVSLFEALGIRIDNPDIATCLLAGILYDTQSFRGQNTTPKSLTVAAQLLAAGGRQQEIVKNFYSDKSTELLKAWEGMKYGLQKDDSRKLLWTKVTKAGGESLAPSDLSEAATDLLDRNPGLELAIILYQDTKKPGTQAIVKNIGSDKGAAEVAGLFGGSGSNDEASFEIGEPNINDAEKIVLKKIADKWKSTDTTEKKELWDVIDKEPAAASQKMVAKKPSEQVPNSVTEKEDAIEEALKSISQAEKDENRKEFESLRDVIDRKKVAGIGIPEIKRESTNETDIFEDE